MINQSIINLCRVSSLVHGRCRWQDMFAAGTDTTSAVMEWAMAELVTHPRAMRKLQDEIRAAVGPASTGGGVVDEGRVAQLHYLKAVVKETLRLHAPIPLLVPREPAADAEILGYHVPARTRVVVNAWAIGRDPAAWEDAEEFVPERFSGSAAVDLKGQHMELVPFGAGSSSMPRGRVRRGKYRGGAGELAVSLRLGGCRGERKPGRGIVAGHERDEWAVRAHQVRPAARSEAVDPLRHTGVLFIQVVFAVL